MRLSTQNCRGKLIFKVAETHLALRSPMFGELCMWFFCVIFSGIVKIAGGFTFKVDYGKSLKILFALSMPQVAPKRCSPNTFNNKLK